jgi:hypothetical protein
MREVRGLGFANAPRAPTNGVPAIPLIVPFVDHRYGRSATLDEPVVALSLYGLVNLATGSSHVTYRAELADRFRIPEGATVIVSGVDKDDPIERWWELKERAIILEALRALGIALVTTPNYSVLTDVPRTDNLHAMKRILLAWTEMAQAGLPAALHVNGRRWRAWYNRLESHRDWVLTPLSKRGQNLPCPPATTIRFCHSLCQVSARRRSPPHSMVA